jgi:predicted TPR repeat methyltransferase
MNTPATYSADYFERGKELGLSCYENYRWLPALTIPMVRALIAGLGIRKTDTILDYGCAKGYVVKALRTLGYNAKGCDISEYAVDCADEVTREHLCLLGADRKLPSCGAEAWDWIICKDVLEHLTHDEIAFTLAEFYSGALNVCAVVPLGDALGERFVIEEMEHDVTHVTRENLAWWRSQFYLRGFAKVSTAYQMRGVKENWTNAYPLGNGFIVAS